MYCRIHHVTFYALLSAMTLGFWLPRTTAAEAKRPMAVATHADSSAGAAGLPASRRPDLRDLPHVDLKADCGARGDGSTNDSAAIRRAAEIIQNAGGGELVIPPGLYIVGEESIKSDRGGAYYQAADMFKVHGLSHLTISGYGAKLRIADGMHYGGFDPKTGLPRDATSGQSNAARVGRMLEISNCEEVLIEGVELDGNNEALVLGGQWGNVDRQAAATGLWINECRNVNVIDVRTHHHALDGITVLHVSGPPPERMPHRLLRVVSEFNGRQGLSWIGGWGLECIDCKFNHTGRAMNRGQPLMSKPRAGLDIEPNVRTTQKSRDGVFVRCEFVDNAGAGALVATGDGGYTTFVGCTFWGTTNYSLYLTKPGLKFIRCRIYGTAAHASDGRTDASADPNPALATLFEGCSFEDKEWKDGRVYRNDALYTLSRGCEGATWRKCTFINHKTLAVRMGNEANTEKFESCTFVHGNSDLPDGAWQSFFEGSSLSNCTFKETAEVSENHRMYFIRLTNVKVMPPENGTTATHVDGPKVQLRSATTGMTGDIPAGVF